MATLNWTSGTTKLTPGTVYDVINGLSSTYDAMPTNVTKIIGAEDPSQPPAIIRRSGNQGYAFKAIHSGLTIQGVEFDRGGFFLEGPNGTNTGFKCLNTSFKINATGGSKKNALELSCKVVDALIEDCLFSGMNSFGIYGGGGGYQRLTIRYNDFVNLGGGMHIDAHGTNSDLRVEQNYIKGARGMGMEFQSTATNLLFQDNWYEKPAFEIGLGSSHGSTMALSLILDKSVNIAILKNIILAPVYNGSQADYVRCMIEGGGDNSIIRWCWIDGGNDGIVINDGVGTCSVTVRDTFVRSKKSTGLAFSGSGRSLTVINSGPTNIGSNSGVNPTFDAELTLVKSRLDSGNRPGRYKRYGSSIPIPPPEPTVITEPTYDSVVVGSVVTASATGQNLRSEIDIEGDGKPNIAQSNGNTITFTVPSDADPSNVLRIRFIGDGGTADKRLTLLPKPVDPTPPDDCENQLVTCHNALIDMTEERDKLQVELTECQETLAVVSDQNAKLQNKVNTSLDDANKSVVAAQKVVSDLLQN